MKRAISILIAAVVLCAAAAVPAADYLVIANKGVAVSALSLTEAQDMFTGNIENWKGGPKVKAAYLSAAAPGCDLFYTGFLGSTADKFKKGWMKKVFAGYGAAPVGCNSAAEVAKYVAETAGGFGLIAAADKDAAASCKVITVSP